MGKYIDLSGMRFGKLTVLSELNGDGKYKTWTCLCDCGNTRIANGNQLRSGHAKSCGCMQILCPNARTHGLKHTREFSIWCDIRKRCYNENSKGYLFYGARGIKMCPEWKSSFLEFYKWAQLNGYDKTLSIERMDNNGDYEPRNCKWATRAEQSRNKRSTIYVEIMGVKKPLIEWCEIFGVNYKNSYEKVRRIKLKTERI